MALVADILCVQKDAMCGLIEKVLLFSCVVSTWIQSRQLLLVIPQSVWLLGATYENSLFLLFVSASFPWPCGRAKGGSTMELDATTIRLLGLGVAPLTPGHQGTLQQASAAGNLQGNGSRNVPASDQSATSHKSVLLPAWPPGQSVLLQSR